MATSTCTARLFLWNQVAKSAGYAIVRSDDFLFKGNMFATYVSAPDTCGG